MIVQTCLRSPADMERGKDIGFAPLHNLAQFVPVLHLLKSHLFHRRAGNDHSVETHILNIVKSLIKFKEMFRGGVFGNMGFHLDQFHIHLKRSVP